MTFPIKFASDLQFSTPIKKQTYDAGTLPCCNKFSTYSFMYAIQGFNFNNLKIQRKEKKEFKQQKLLLLEKGNEKTIVIR